MIEQKIDALIEALTKNTEALIALNKGTAPAPTAEKPKKEKAEKVAPAAPPETKKEEPPADEGPTLQQIRDAAQALLDGGKLDVIQQLNAKYNLKRVSEAHGTENCVAVYAALTKAVTALKAATDAV